MNDRDESNKKPLKRQVLKMLARVGFGIACLVTLVALAYAVENWRGKHAWQKYRLEWEGKGEKFTIAGLVPPPVPDEKNFALTPFLKPMLDCSVSPSGEIVWNDTNGLARLRQIAVDLRTQSGMTEPIVLGSLDKGTFADVAAWAEFYRGNTNYPPAPEGATPAETVITALGKLEPLFRELREAASVRPYSRYPIQYSAQPPWGVVLPHLAHVKRIANALDVMATAELEGGHSAEAFREIQLGLWFSDSIREEPLIISHLVRIVMLGSGLQTVREGLVRHAWTDEQLRVLQASFSSVNLLAECKTAMRGEQAGAADELDYLRRHGDWGLNVEAFFGTRITTCGQILGLGPSGWTYQNMLSQARLCIEHTLPAMDERVHRIFPEAFESGARALERRRGPYTLYPKLMHPALNKILQRSGRMQTFADAARLACALERYRLLTGKLPESLEALTPRFCERIPQDLMDGQQLRWRHHVDGGYTLYSLGWNLTNDGGSPGWSQDEDSGVFGLLKEKTGAWVDPAQGDWVWEMPASLPPHGGTATASTR